MEYSTEMTKKWDGVKVEDIAKRTQIEFNDF